jgi:hypothetical protein
MNQYRKYMIVQLATILGVILIFKLVSPKELAGLINGILFTISSAYIVYSERKRFPRSLSGWGAIIFIVMGVLPVALGRLLTLGSEFNSSLIFGGLTGADLHRFSNYPFILMLMSFFVESYRERSRAQKDQ